MIFPDLFLEGEIFPEKGESYCFALESPGWPFINRVRTRTLKGLDTQTSDHCVLSSRWPCVGRQPNGHERVRELGILMSHRSEFSVGKSHLPIVHFPFLLFFHTLLFIFLLHKQLFNFLFYIGIWPISSVVIVSGAQKGTQPYTCMYPLSPKLSSHPGCHITLSRVPCAIE